MQAGSTLIPTSSLGLDEEFWRFKNFIVGYKSDHTIIKKQAPAAAPFLFWGVSPRSWAYCA